MESVSGKLIFFFFFLRNLNILEAAQEVIKWGKNEANLIGKLY